MNRPNISSATILPKLRIILSMDIDTLSKMLNRRKPVSKSYKLIDSLIAIKKSILEEIPNNTRGIGASPTTAQASNLTTYKNEVLTDFHDEAFISKALHSIEKDQYNYVKYAMSADGLPKGVRKILDSILDKYHHIVNQLERNQKTNQINALV